MEKVKLRLKLLVSYLDNGDVKKAKENYLQIAEHLGDAEFNKGYSKAINGIVTSIEKNDRDSIIYKIVSKEIDKRDLKKLLLESTKKTSDIFRTEEERGFETAWVDVLSIYVEKAGA
ncbi:MAG: hypothetical protein GX941_02130 [Candidatus Methanofastidiosa archaeon]|nr:hypothetical protein [Candidatus Methanofastidiosa archaeon]HOM95473.1 hypothetical protein [Methanofastidiosum sp.]HPC80640.1 hypothetical protein [Methanofastidiosum sp.]HRS25345.1 hypothetical protein [Methanofastidiosum sp.]